MAATITVRLPDDLARWLEQAARKWGVPKARIVREQLERARSSAGQPFLRWAGAVSGPADLSRRKGFARRMYRRAGRETILLIHPREC